MVPNISSVISEKVNNLVYSSKDIFGTGMLIPHERFERVTARA